MANAQLCETRGWHPAGSRALKRVEATLAGLEQLLIDAPSNWGVDLRSTLNAFLNTSTPSGAWCEQQIRRSHQWEWHACGLATFEKESFCNALGNSSILVVGDSLSEAFAIELAASLRATWATSPPPLGVVRWSVCDHHAQLEYIRNDVLDSSMSYQGGRGGLNK
eukprot:6552752-Prymnesium_polylepis.1